jgi:hypothetical protein
MDGAPFEEAPHDEAGFYACECGRDRHGQPYNRRSVMHGHKRSDARQQFAMTAAHIRSRYGTAEQARNFWRQHGWYSAGGEVAMRDKRQRLPGWQAPPSRVRRAKGTTWIAVLVIAFVLALVFWPVTKAWLGFLF